MNFSREDIAVILKRQNKFFNSAEITFENIEYFKNSNTFAVVTGQQVGMLSGNYYTILKAINTIQLAKQLSETYPELKFVPVFWLESEDHDFLEANHVNIINKQNKPLEISYYENGEEKEKYLKSVGSIQFDSFLNEFRKSLEDNLLPTDFTADVFDYVLGDSGLIFIDPSDEEIKKILLPVFEKELNTFPKACELVIETSVLLEQEYSAQVKPRPVNLFFNHTTGRHLIEQRPDNVFALRNSRQRFQAEELFELLYSKPELFSPNVILRPICQDYLLPTVAYIGGPSEVAYFAQFKKVYEFYGINMPVIYPRTSVTLLENKVNNFLIKYGVSLVELFDERKVTAYLMSKVNEIKIDDIFDNFKDELNALLYVISNDIRKIDKNLESLMKNKTDKYFESLEQVKSKLLDSQMKQNDTSIEKLKSIINNIYPESHLQERYINIIYFMNKYGVDFAKFLFEKLDINNFNHQVIPLNFSV